MKNVLIVPIRPNLVIFEKFSKNFRLLILQPVVNMIKGSSKVKKRSLFQTRKDLA